MAALQKFRTNGSGIGRPPCSGRVFLSAEWRDLVMLNYRVDPGLLTDHVPHGTELDFFDGSTFVSLVGFRFLDTKILGSLAFPFHGSFDEINLRFYIRRGRASESRRGVAFIREMVPKRVIANVARLVYGENYTRCPMRHRITSEGSIKTAEYECQFNRRWSKLFAQASGDPALPQRDTLEEFITEHYWGYSAKSRVRSFEYRVSHTPWRVWVRAAGGFEGDGVGIYGQELGNVLNREPDSAFIAEGSQVVVHNRRVIS